MGCLKYHEYLNKTCNFLSFEKKFKRVRHLYKYIRLSTYRGSLTEKIPYIWTLGICALPLPTSCPVPMALCSECRFSLKENTPPAVSVGTSGTASCFKLSPGGECGCWHPYRALQTDNTSKMGHFKDTE